MEGAGWGESILGLWVWVRGEYMGEEVGGASIYCPIVYDHFEGGGRLGVDAEHLEEALLLEADGAVEDGIVGQLGPGSHSNQINL